MPAHVLLQGHVGAAGGAAHLSPGAACLRSCLLGADSLLVLACSLL